MLLVKGKSGLWIEIGCWGVFYGRPSAHRTSVSDLYDLSGSLRSSITSRDKPMGHGFGHPAQAIEGVACEGSSCTERYLGSLGKNKKVDINTR